MRSIGFILPEQRFRMQGRRPRSRKTGADEGSRDVPTAMGQSLAIADAAPSGAEGRPSRLPVGPHDYHLQALEHAAVALIVLRALDQVAYQRLAHGDDDGFAAIEALYRALDLFPGSADFMAHENPTLEKMEAALIIGTCRDLLADVEGQQEFARRYVEAINRSREAANSMYDTCQQHLSQYGWRELGFGALTPLIDMASHTPTR